KADICSDPEARVAEVEGHAVGVPVHVISALHAEGVEAVRAFIRDGMTVALVGSSGAGKSTLVNALLGEERMRTGEVRASDGRGRHVTTHRQLVLLPGGGLLLDTPGMRELQLLDDDGIDTVFKDIAALAGRCRFRDCRHDTEPGCAVREAVESGALHADRFEHYRKLEHEAQANELRHDEHRRRQAERVWGQLSDEVAQLRKWKGGKP
ncbi:MAG: ribosome small subunit-dependent GTPase A, partial [Acidobacteriota bacterium]